MSAASLHPLYPTWQSMLRRCSDRAHFAYHRYGGRGITVCERWRIDFWAFVADMGSRPDKHTLDRINNSGNYEPDNCRWATWDVQGKNRTLGRLLTFNGLTQTLPQWAKQLGLPAHVIRKRLWKGWSVERALAEPLGLPLVKRSPEERRALAAKGGRSVPAHKRAFSKDPDFARIAGAKGGGAMPSEKRSFSIDRKLASEAGRRAHARS